MFRVFAFIVTVSFLLLNCISFKQSAKSYAPEMVYVEGGTFFFGDFYKEENTDALPLHEVTVAPFWIGKYEVTFEQYDQFAKATGRPFPEDNGYGRGKRAVANITWDDALAFCQSLGYRLPSEVEWEYAARSGGKNHLFSGTNNTDSLHRYAAVQNSAYRFSLQVGSFTPNKLGLYDMSGNVFEWIGEFYQFYRFPNQFHNHTKDGIRIIRGGSFLSLPITARTYWRVGTLHDTAASDIGFRCVKSK